MLFRSNSLMEAMACGCCCVASEVGGNPEIVQHGETGLLFRSGDSADLARKLATLLADETLRCQFIAAGLESIHRSFSVNASVTRMQAIYDSVVR